jgi:hypothetical protein
MTLTRTLHSRARDLIQNNRMEILLEPPPETFDWEWNDNDLVTDSPVLAQCDATTLNAGDAEPSLFQLRQ